MSAALWIFWTSALAVLAKLAHRAWMQAREREAMDAALDARWDALMLEAKRLDAQCAAMDRGMSDAGICECCQQPAAVRELVTLHDDATLACPACADLLRGRVAA